LQALADLQQLALPAAVVDDDTWRVASAVARALRDGGAEDSERDGALLRFSAARRGRTAAAIFAVALEGVPRALGVNDFEDTRWFHRESAERLIDLLEAVGVAEADEGDALRTAIEASKCRVAAFVPPHAPSANADPTRPADHSA
jgi:hypothetical protein